MALLSQCPSYQFKTQLQADLDAFLKRNFVVEASVVSISFVGQQKHNVLSLRGKLPIKLQSRTRPVGFKFILPAQYPIIPPYVYLDEPENPQVAELLDYIEKNNRIKTDFLTNWTTRNNDPNWKPKLNLSQLLLEVFELFTKAPPLSFEEMQVDYFSNFFNFLLTLVSKTSIKYPSQPLSLNSTPTLLDGDSKIYQLEACRSILTLVAINGKCFQACLLSRKRIWKRNLIFWTTC